MEFFLTLIVAFALSFFVNNGSNKSSGKNTKSEGLNNYEKFDMFNKFNKK